MRLLGTESPPNEEALKEVLKAQTQKISDVVVVAMEAPIKLEELFEAASKLTQNKVPGWDGMLVEFYLRIWDQIGLLLSKFCMMVCKTGIFTQYH